MKSLHYFYLGFAIFGGALLALLAWTLIVKNQITAQVAANPTALSVLDLASKL